MTLYTSTYSEEQKKSVIHRDLTDRFFLIEQDVTEFDECPR